MRRATSAPRFTPTTSRNFYPRSPCGERRHFSFLWPSRVGFLSTLSLRRATLIRYLINAKYTNFYPRSPCGERRIDNSEISDNLTFLSTLSLRRATHQNRLSPNRKKISIHALLAESDNILCVVSVQIGRFLSTLSLRRATTSSTVIVILRKNFYPRSPCGERRRYKQTS